MFMNFAEFFQASIQRQNEITSKIDALQRARFSVLSDWDRLCFYTVDRTEAQDLEMAQLSEALDVLEKDIEDLHEERDQLRYFTSNLDSACTLSRNIKEFMRLFAGLTRTADYDM